MIASGFQFVEKASLFDKLNPYHKWKRGLSPLFQAFFPLQLVFFLNQAAVFRQSQSPMIASGFPFGFFLNEAAFFR